jgi:uncharacterized protein with HEPN domain
MQRKTPKHLADIRDAASFVLELTRARMIEDYRADRLLRQAVERNLEIMGEAMKRLAHDDPATAALIGDHPRIIAFRNVLAHGYDLVDDEQVWRIIRDHLPALAAKVESLLADAG